MRKIAFILTIASFFMLSGCATIFTPNSSKLTIYNGYPKNAEIYLNDELLGTAPLELWIDNQKLKNENLLEIKSPGFETALVEVDLKTDAAYFISEMFFIVPLAVDFYTGAIYKPKPSSIKYKLRSTK